MQPTRDSIAAAVSAFILEEFLPGEDPRSLTPTTPLISGGILDSLSRLKLVDFLEERYAIQIEAHEAHEDHMDTIERIVDLVLAKHPA